MQMLLSLRNISMPKPFSCICSWPLSVIHIITL